MTLSDFKAVIKSIFYVIMLMFFLSVFLLVSIYTNSILSVNQKKIDQSKGAIRHMLEIEDRFLAEEFLSGSFSSVAMRVDRALKSFRISSYELYINEQGECIYPDPTTCLNLTKSKGQGYFTLTYDVEVLNEKYGALTLIVPETEFVDQLTFLDQIKLYVIPLGIIILLFFIWFKYLDRKIIAPYLNKLLQIEKKLAVQRVSRQVAHDIRSPVGALEMIDYNEKLDAGSLKILSSAIARIRGIADDLLSENTSEDNAKAQNVYLQLKKVIELKKLEYAGENVEIKMAVEKVDIFCEFEKNLFYRCISNLINNSYEAFENGEGVVEVELDKDAGGRARVRITDNGSGIPPQVMKDIFNEGFTTKNEGNGLGLSRIRDFVESFAGSVEIKSELGKGTSVEIKFPRAETPSWFIGELVIPKSSKIVCLDDDIFYAESFNKKFRSHQVSFFSSSEKLLRNLAGDSIALIDYDFKEGINGLDLIEKHQLQASSYLVTNMDEDEDLQKLCALKGVKLIPKDILFDENFKVKTQDDAGIVDSSYVLIDDDPLIHKLWEMEAEKYQCRLTCFSSVEGFLKESNSFRPDTTIFIDSNLGREIKGEIEAEKIFSLGFLNLSLCTGYNKDHIQVPPYIKNVVGKRPCFQ